VRRWLLPSAIVPVVAVALLIGTSGGGDGENDNPPATPSATATPLGDGGATQPRPGQLPPAFVSMKAGPVSGPVSAC
jgi:hypothetical protein